MILVLGGTRFLGRHIVETLAGRGHRVTCFHRGTSRCALPAGTREILGDRNDALPDLLRQRWDAIVDVSGQLPSQVERSLVLDAQRYVFISTLNVYADLSRSGVDEDSPTIETFDESDAAAAYGGRKAACERLVLERYGQRATLLRPGIIAGPWDYTGRLTYWPRRALRGGRFAVPAPPERPMQFIDARDIAAFVAEAIERQIAGTFNVAGSASAFSFGELVRACAAAANERGVEAVPVYVSPQSLHAHGIEPWTDLPMWIEDASFTGIFSVRNAKAISAGMGLRAPIETIRSLMDWLETPEANGAAQPGLSAQREAELLR
jgi:2'-hydroxyisoflavone reductase